MSRLISLLNLVIILSLTLHTNKLDSASSSNLWNKGQRMTRSITEKEARTACAIKNKKNTGPVKYAGLALALPRFYVVALGYLAMIHRVGRRDLGWADSR